MSYSNQKQSIPACFHEKARLDVEWDQMKATRVVDFMASRKLKHLRDTARFKCIQNVAKKLDAGVTA